MRHPWRKADEPPTEQYRTSDVVAQVRDAAEQLRDVYARLEPALHELEQRFPAKQEGTTT